MESKYKIIFDNYIPTWEELKYENSGTNHSYNEVNIYMKVYEYNVMIYSVKLKFIGNYYCCGSYNFEFDKIKTDVIKKCNIQTIDSIYTELQTNYKNIFDGSVLDIWKTRIFKELCYY